MDNLPLLISLTEIIALGAIGGFLIIVVLGPIRIRWPDLKKPLCWVRGHNWYGWPKCNSDRAAYWQPLEPGRRYERDIVCHRCHARDRESRVLGEDGLYDPNKDGGE